MCGHVSIITGWSGWQGDNRLFSISMAPVRFQLVHLILNWLEHLEKNILVLNPKSWFQVEPIHWHEVGTIVGESYSTGHWALCSALRWRCLVVYSGSPQHWWICVLPKNLKWNQFKNQSLFLLEKRPQRLEDLKRDWSRKFIKIICQSIVRFIFTIL